MDSIRIGPADLDQQAGFPTVSGAEDDDPGANSIQEHVAVAS